MTGVFSDQRTAQKAVDALRIKGVASNHLTLLTPGDMRAQSTEVSIDAAEQPGIGKALGAVVGAAGCAGFEECLGGSGHLAVRGLQQEALEVEVFQAFRVHQLEGPHPVAWADQNLDQRAEPRGPSVPFQDQMEEDRCPVAL